MHISDVNKKIAMTDLPLYGDVYNGQTRGDGKLAHIFYLLGCKINKITYLELGTNGLIKINKTFWLYKRGEGHVSGTES